MADTTRSPRLYLHPEGKIISIGFEGSNDTLLSLEFGAAVYNPEIDRDRGDMLTLREWVEAVSGALSEAVPTEAQIGALHDELLGRLGERRLMDLGGRGVIETMLCRVLSASDPEELTAEIETNHDQGAGE